MQDDGDFTFAMAAPLSVGGHRIGAGRLYPVFGRSRSPPHRLTPDRETTLAAARVPLGQVLLMDREPAAGLAQPPDCGEPAKTCYCSCCPALSSPAGKTATRCRKSGSTGSLFRWRQRILGRSHSDGKEKFVFLDASPSQRKGKSGVADKGGGAWSYYAKAGAGAGVNGGLRRSFLPYRQDLVGLFASATAFRRSYHPF